VTRSFYEVLGVADDASREAIEEAYQERVEECHPAVSPDPDANSAGELGPNGLSRQCGF